MDINTQGMLASPGITVIMICFYLLLMNESNKSRVECG
jgi:hypothetical protein